MEHHGGELHVGQGQRAVVLRVAAAAAGGEGHGELRAVHPGAVGHLGLIGDGHVAGRAAYPFQTGLTVGVVALSLIEAVASGNGHRGEHHRRIAGREHRLHPHLAVGARGELRRRQVGLYKEYVLAALHNQLAHESAGLRIGYLHLGLHRGLDGGSCRGCGGRKGYD